MDKEITDLNNIRNYQIKTLRINNKEYSISVIFNLNDALEYKECLNETENAKKAIACIIYEKLKLENNALTLQEIENQDESFFIKYINALVSVNEKIYKHYVKTDNKLQCTERFANAFKYYIDDYKNELLNIKSSISNIESPISNILSSNFCDFQKVYDNQFKQISNIIKNLFNFKEYFLNIIKKLPIPEISEERKNELESNYKKWGELGWTLIPTMTVDIFNNNPDKIKDVNKMAMIYCQKQDIKELFNILRAQNIKKSDLDEAIFCYENRQYKSCANIIFGIIDSKLIRKMPNERWRPCGKKAVEKIEKEVEQSDDFNKTFLLMLNYVNLMSCMEVIFENGSNFQKEPKIINRNFIAHGMNKRPVRKRDCIQLFLVLYNFNNLLKNLKRYKLI